MAKRRKVKKTDVPIHHLNESQVTLLMKHIHEEADNARRNGNIRTVIDEIVVVLLLHTGVMAQELPEILIRDTPIHHHEEALYIGRKKGKKGRRIPLDHETTQMIIHFIENYRKEARSNQPLIINERGNRFNYISLYSKLQRISKRSGIGQLEPSILRHTFIVRLFQKCQDLRIVQEQAGHVSPKTTAKHLEGSQPCDACRKITAIKECVRIDSGQVLCLKCLEELRYA
jgi:site-specific recombinase XerD